MWRALFLCLFPLPALACETALILTIDVSNSIDVAEYRIQTEGLADALDDAEIVETLVQGESALSVVQWSGTDKQEVSLDWRQMRTSLDVQAFALDVRHMPRAFVLSVTAPAEAIMFSLDHFRMAPACERRVIDISGDGTANSGGETRDARNLAERAGVTINAVAIESMGLAITNFYRGAVITRNGFVVTARTHRDYPRAIRTKLIRELSQVLG